MPKRLCRHNTERQAPPVHPRPHPLPRARQQMPVPGGPHHRLPRSHAWPATRMPSSRRCRVPIVHHCARGLRVPSPTGGVGIGNGKIWHNNSVPNSATVVQNGCLDIRQMGKRWKKGRKSVGQQETCVATETRVCTWQAAAMCCGTLRHAAAVGACPGSHFQRGRPGFHFRGGGGSIEPSGRTPPPKRSQLTGPPKSYRD